MRIRNAFEEFVCLRSNLSNDNIMSAYRPGLKTSMDLRVLVWQRVWKITFFGLIGSGFEEPGNTPPPGIPRSTPRAFENHILCLFRLGCFTLCVLELAVLSSSHTCNLGKWAKSLYLQNQITELKPPEVRSRQIKGRLSEESDCSRVGWLSDLQIRLEQKQSK